MADNFTAEAVSSSGEIFATDQNAGDSAHYPVGKLAWGPLNTFNLTDTANPFPVQLIEGSSAGPIFSHGDSAGTPSGVALVYESDTGANTFSVVGRGTPLPVQMVTDPVNVLVTDIDTAAFSGIIQNVAYSSAANGYDATNSALRVSLAAGLNDSSSPVFVDNNSAHPVFVRGVTDSTIPVSGTISISGSVATSTNMTVTNAPDTTVTVTAGTITGITTAGNDGGALDSTNSAIRVNIVAGSTTGDSTVTISNDSTQPVVVKHATPGDTNEFVFVKSAGGNYPVTQSTIPWTVVGNNDTSNRVVVQGQLSGGVLATKEQYTAVSTAGSIVAQTFSLTSAAQTVMTLEGRLHGYSLSNPDTSVNVWVNVFQDDTAGVTIGTTTPVISVMVPFGGGREMSQNPLGVYMSSGMTIVASGGAGTDTSSPSTTIEATFYFAPSS